MLGRILLQLQMRPSSGRGVTKRTCCTCMGPALVRQPPAGKFRLRRAESALFRLSLEAHVLELKVLLADGCSRHSRRHRAEWKVSRV